MSGGASEGNQFDQLVNQNLLLNGITPNQMNNCLVGINMKAKNYQGYHLGVNLEHTHMAKMRNQLYCHVIQKKVELEDSMLKQVLENEVPDFSVDGFYSHISGRAQCLLGSLFGKLEDQMVCCGSVVLKRKQGLTDDQVENCPGTLVDLIPNVYFQIDASNSLSDWL